MAQKSPIYSIEPDDPKHQRHHRRGNVIFRWNKNQQYTDVVQMPCYIHVRYRADRPHAELVPQEQMAEEESNQSCLSDVVHSCSLCYEALNLPKVEVSRLRRSLYATLLTQQSRFAPPQIPVALTTLHVRSA